MGYRSRDKQNEAWRKWYSKNGKRKYEWQKRRRKELRQWWDELKATKRCDHCGESAPECLHFHHRDPSQKKDTLSNAVGQGWTKERLLEELAKCDVLCANCHMKRHWDERRLAAN
jgi:hypothetical protein